MSNCRWTLAGVASFLIAKFKCGEIGQMGFFEETSTVVDSINGIITEMCEYNLVSYSLFRSVQVQKGQKGSRRIPVEVRSGLSPD